jgi:predicted ABC-type transport system involved in lysophospholipase L1 biosynthesis ATPase subunit
MAAKQIRNLFRTPFAPHEAPVIFADEPTVSLDARTWKMAADMLLGQTAHGASFVLEI